MSSSSETLTPPTPPHLARLGPPPDDVRAAVQGALKACHDWRPVLSQAPVPPPPVKSVAASICDTIDDWPSNADNGIVFGVLGGVLLTLLAVAAWVQLCRLSRFVARTRVGRAIGPALHEPDAVLILALVGALLGGAAGASTSHAWAGGVVGALVAATAWALARKWQQRRRQGAWT